MKLTIAHSLELVAMYYSFLEKIAAKVSQVPLGVLAFFMCYNISSSIVLLMANMASQI